MNDDTPMNGAPAGRVTTTDAGIPASSHERSLTVGADGPIVLHDHYVVQNLVGHLGDGVERVIRDRAVALWRQADAGLGARVAQGLGIIVREDARAAG